MSVEEKGKPPVTLRVDIKPEALKRVVAEGRLMEFVNAFSALAAEQVAAQVVDQLVKGIATVSINVGFDTEEPYLTGYPPGPRPKWPWPIGTLDAVLRQVVK